MLSDVYIIICFMNINCFMCRVARGRDCCCDRCGDTRRRLTGNGVTLSGLK